MKREKINTVRISILISTLLIFCLFSCSKVNDNETGMTDSYFFRMSNGMSLKAGGDGNIPVKINPVTKNATPVCVDPLCNHYTDCPLYNCGNIYATGNYLFYTKGDMSIDAQTGERSGSINLYAYDMINGNLRQIAEYKDSLLFAGGAKSYLYYYIAQYNEADNIKRVDYILYRADAKNGKIIEMPMYSTYSTEGNGIGLGNCPNIYIIKDDKIYWYATENDNLIFYTTDLNGQSKKNLDFGGNKRVMNGIYDSGYAYYTDSYLTNEEFNKLSGNYEKWRSLRDMKLYRIPLTGGSGELIAEHITAFAPCGDKVYYTVLEENPELVEYNGEKYWNWSGGKVYVMNSNSTDKKLLCETGYDLYGFSGFIDAKTVDGIDYIAFSFYGIVENSFYESGYEYNHSPNILLINGATGEYTELTMPRLY